MTGVTVRYQITALWLGGEPRAIGVAEEQENLAAITPRVRTMG